jgi:hypothetical protein
MQLAVCQICKYPVWSYICPDCLAKGIREWLPSELSSEFSKFNRLLLEHFKSIESNFTQIECIHCHMLKESTLCSFCYITEAFQWLHEKNRRLARTLFMTLPPDSRLRIASGVEHKWSEIKPISFTESETDEELCDECGEFSEQTTLANGKCVCENCRDYE